MTRHEAGTGDRSRRYDTTPTDDERAQAAVDMAETGANRADRDETRRAYALGYIGGTLGTLTEAADEDQARRIARARAVYDAWQEVR